MEVNLSSCAVDTDYVNNFSAKKPNILVVNYTNPFALNEMYNVDTRGRFKGILATFKIEPEALLGVITGKFNLSGKDVLYHTQKSGCSGDD